jgi:hypothetical protein
LLFGDLLVMQRTTYAIANTILRNLLYPFRLLHVII